MKALISDPLLRNTDCGIDTCTTIPPLLEEDQPEGATEETEKRRIDDRERPKPIRKVLCSHERMGEEGQDNRDRHTYEP
jgi:hypothetical protein